MYSQLVELMHTVVHDHREIYLVLYDDGSGWIGPSYSVGSLDTLLVDLDIDLLYATNKEADKAFDVFVNTISPNMPNEYARLVLSSSGNVLVVADVWETVYSGEDDQVFYEWNSLKEMVEEFE